MVHQHSVKEVDVVFSQSAQIQESVDLGRLEGQLRKTYPLSGMHFIACRLLQTHIFSFALHTSPLEGASIRKCPDISEQEQEGRCRDGHYDNVRQ